MTFPTQSKNHNKIKRDIGCHILNGLNFNTKQRETLKATHPTIVYLFFSLLTLPNNKISETTKKRGTYIHRRTDGNTATASANYRGPKTQIAKNVKTTNIR